MKKAILFLIALGLVFTACKKKDTSPPVVFLEGDDPYYIVLNDYWEDPGITADDNFDGESVANTVEVTHDIEINGPDNGDGVTKKRGDYTVNYTCKDKAGNSTTRTRTVYVRNHCEKYATRYEVSKTGDEDIFPNFTGIPMDVDYDDYTNDKFWVPKLSNWAGFRIYCQILNDTMIDLPVQFRRVADTLYVVRGNSGQSWFTDTIDYTFTLKYTLDKYRKDNTYGVILPYYGDTVEWYLIKNAVNTEVYIRY